MQTKTCSHCKVEKPFDAFSPHKKTKSGLASWCRECTRGHYKTKTTDPVWLEQERTRNRERMRALSAERVAEINLRRNQRARENPLSGDALLARRARLAAWKVKNPDKWNAYCAKRRADKMQATPAWADLKAIEAIYSAAQTLSATTGIEHHVDHIVPLRSKIVCGLHVPCNLRVVPWAENLAKGNRHWPDMP